jgi:alkylhydroperoxidase/carboxymuconolactone decarboxylase family protein YurZ
LRELAELAHMSVSSFHQHFKAVTSMSPLQFQKALANGLTKEELIEVITHLAFYSGWPNAMNAITIAKELFSKKDVSG